MNIVCKECGTENEQEYEYCKNCGTLLEKPQQNSDYSPPFSNNDNLNSTYDEFIFDGVTQTELSLFIGKKSKDILPKFQKMKLSESKISWCWPLAILSFIFGPFGAALWFFYRKIYKAAFLFSGIGFLLSAIIAALNFNQTDILTDTLLDAFASGDFEAVLNFLNNADYNQIGLSFISNSLQDIADISTAVITALFGYHIYLNHCISKIKTYKQTHTDSRFYQMGISAIGGISGGMLFLGILFMFGTDAILSFITSIISIII